MGRPELKRQDGRPRAAQWESFANAERKPTPATLFPPVRFFNFGEWIKSENRYNRL